MVDESILRRARALLELREDRGASANEAANAALLLSKLLLEHGLSMAELDVPRETTDRRQSEIRAGEGELEWHMSLMTAACELCFCRGLARHNDKAGTLFMFFGQPTDVACCERLFRFFVESARRSAEIAFNMEVDRASPLGMELFLNYGWGAPITIQSDSRGRFIAEFLRGYGLTLLHRARRHLQHVVRDVRCTDLVTTRTSEAETALQDVAREMGGDAKPFTFDNGPAKDLRALMAGVMAAARAPLEYTPELVR
jgi:uncharacterized protein DUF2786